MTSETEYPSSSSRTKSIVRHWSFRITLPGIVIGIHKKVSEIGLKEQQIPGLFGIDTRALTQKLRDHGAMLGKILFDNEDIPYYDPNKDNIVAEVSTKKIMEYGKREI